MLNILILGLGQCGNRILDAINREAFGSGGTFAKYYSRQKFPASVKTIAINTAINDLKELKGSSACPAPSWCWRKSNHRTEGV